MSKVNDLLDGVLCKSYFYFHIFSLFCFSIMILSDAFILPVSQLQKQQVLTSQNRSHIKYLVQLTIFLCSFY